MQAEEIKLVDNEQCQQNTHLIQNFLDGNINSTLNLENSPNMMEIATYRSNKTSKIIQQLTLDDTVIPIPTEVHTPITENHRISTSVSNVNSNFQKLDCELNKCVNYGFTL